MLRILLRVFNRSKVDLKYFAMLSTLYKCILFVVNHVSLTSNSITGSDEPNNKSVS